AKIGLVEVTIGTIPGWGGTQRLSNIVGLGLAKELILTGKVLSAKEAESIHLVNHVVEKEKGMSTAKEIADKICQNSPYAIEHAKHLVNFAALNNLSNGISMEKKISDLIFISKDRTEGINS